MTTYDFHPKRCFNPENYGNAIKNMMIDLFNRSQMEIRGHVVNTPDGSRHYKGCWVRDFTMLCEIGRPIINSDYMRNGLDLFVKHQGPNEQVPDWVPWDPEKKVVYALFDRHYFLDNPFWLLRLMVLYLEATNDLNYFIKNEQAIFRGLNSMNLMNMEDPLLKIEGNDLSNIRDDWGFTDCILKTGVVLFSNLLKIDALRSLSAIYNALGNHEKASLFEHQRKLVIHGLECLWDPHQNLYYSASEIGHRIDVWGNAFAVYADLLPKERLREISEALLENRGKIIWNGQVRHLFLDDFWDGFHEGASFLAKRQNEYQNGAYWGTPSGWMCMAFENVKNGAGQALMNDLLKFYLNTGVYECVFPKRWRRMYKKCNYYVASLSLPYRLLDV